jgi:pimeloyl-ACP methyl ester carboxylesterase
MRLVRPDGAELAWEAVGDGPAVLLVNQFIGDRTLYEELIGDLARDHRVVTYDPRGTGASSRRGPYDEVTDDGDLEAVAEAVGTPAVLLGVSDGNNRAARLAARRPDLAPALVAIAGSALGLTPAGSDALAGSPQVLSAFVTLMSSDLRAGVRTMMTAGGPGDMEEEHVRARVDAAVAYTDAEAASTRLRDWVGDLSTDEPFALGDRLWILAYGGNPWFPVDQADRMRRVLPEAHVVELDNGPISRPDLTAAVVRGVTGPAPGQD